jgi:hypothetical protein
MQAGATLGNVLETKSTLLSRVDRMIGRLETSIRQITKEPQRLQAARRKAQPSAYPAKQSPRFCRGPPPLTAADL